MNITSSKPAVYYEGELLERYDAVLPRIGSNHTFYGTAVVRQFEAMKCCVVNGSLSIARARDKLRSLQLLAHKGIGLPATGFAHSTHTAKQLIKMMGGTPLIIKLTEGTQGIGVTLAKTEESAEATINVFNHLKSNILVQQYIEEANGSDIRCFVVDGKVVGSMKRQANKGEFRSNLHRGGTAEKIKITSQERRVAIQAAKVMGLKVAGVDLLRSKHGPVVMEVNASPGLEGITHCTGLSIADFIIRYIEKQITKCKKYERITA